MQAISLHYFRRNPMAAVLALACMAVGLAQAQPAVDLPRASPMATVSQTFGYTTATVVYCRPKEKDRVIWGGLVPYGQVWRAGANEATTLELTTDARVNGQALPKGKYGLFVLPAEKDWTFILSKTNKTWGAFTYDQKDDALRVTVVPQPAPDQERLEYAFEAISDSGASLTLKDAKRAAMLAREAAAKDPAGAFNVASIDKAVAGWDKSGKK